MGIYNPASIPPPKTSTKPELEISPQSRLRDPLSEVTRRERRSLLGISVLGLVVAKLGFVPAKVTAFGVEFNPANQRALVHFLGYVISFYLVAFLIYAVSDFVNWRLGFAADLRTSLRE